MKAFKAKFPGICALSKAPIYPGDMVYYNAKGLLCLQVDSDSIAFRLDHFKFVTVGDKK